MSDLQLSAGQMRYIPRPTPSPDVPTKPAGLAAIVGKWPGDETDEEIDELLGASHAADEWPVDDASWVSEYPGLPSTKSLLPCPGPASVVPRPGPDTLIDRTYRRDLLCFPA